MLFEPVQGASLHCRQDWGMVIMEMGGSYSSIRPRFQFRFANFHREMPMERPLFQGHTVGKGKTRMAGPRELPVQKP